MQRGGWQQCTRATHSRAAGCNTGLAGVTRVGCTQLKKPLIFANQGLLFGGLGRNRTTDTRIFNPPKKPKKINDLAKKLSTASISKQSIGHREFSSRERHCRSFASVDPDLRIE